MDVLDVDALRGKAADRQLRDLPGLVGRIVQHLDFEQLARILDPAHRLDQPVDDVHLVVERELDGDRRQRVEATRRHRLLVLVLHVQIHKVVAVPPVNGEDDEDEKVRREDEGFSGRHVRSGLPASSTITDYMVESSKVNETGVIAA